MKQVKHVQEVAYHRNGIAGEGFYAVRFVADIEPSDGREGDPPTSGRKDANWLAILFDGKGRCAVTCLDMIETAGVKFAGGNSWRGDVFEPELREAIRAATESGTTSGGIRVGPFIVPKD